MKARDDIEKLLTEIRDIQRKQLELQKASSDRETNELGIYRKLAAIVFVLIAAAIVVLFYAISQLSGLPSPG